MGLDGPDAKARDAVRVVFAGKKVREEYSEAVPDIDQFEWIEDARTRPPKETDDRRQARREVLLQSIQWAFDAACGVARDMGVDHGR